MRILITGSGTRGDVQPSAALADALVRAGHATTLPCRPASTTLNQHPKFVELAEALMATEVSTSSTNAGQRFLR